MKDLDLGVEAESSLDAKESDCCPGYRVLVEPGPVLAVAIPIRQYDDTDQQQQQHKHVAQHRHGYLQQCPYEQTNGLAPLFALVQALRVRFVVTVGRVRRHMAAPDFVHGVCYSQDRRDKAVLSCASSSFSAARCSAEQRVRWGHSLASDVQSG